MHPYTILCVDDEREVLDSVVSDLEFFNTHFEIEAAESVAEARSVIDQMAAENTQLALILCDHVMPGTQGVDFLIELNQQEETQKARKVLLTGQAGLEATITAVNRGGLDFYLAKPWTTEQLREVVIDQLTTFIVANEPEMIPYAKILDETKIFSAIHKKGLF
jgi:CheY-like chemotaxis protein